MRKEAKVLLIYPPNQLFSIETPRTDGSLGPLYLAGALERAGFEVDVLDASVGMKGDDLQNTFYRLEKLPNGLVSFGMTFDHIKKVIIDNGYNVIGISSNHTPQTKTVIKLASVIKSISRDILIIVGGVNTRNLSERFLDSGNVDVVCLTEGEKIIVNIVRAWSCGEGFNNLSGITYCQGNKNIVNPVKSGDFYTNLDDLPFPAWHKLPFEQYKKAGSSHAVLTSPGLKYSYIMTSRGCPFKCAYCHNSTEKTKDAIAGDVGCLRLKSVDRVLREMEILKSLGVKKLFFEDDSLLAIKKRVKEIFSRAKNMNFEIEDVNGVNLVNLFKRKKSGAYEIDVAFLEFLKEVGIKQMVFPVESGSQRILNAYATSKLNLEKLDLVELARITSDLGIRCPINIMIGFPDETEEEMMRGVELGKKLVQAGAPYCTFFIVIPFPGSKLFEIAISKGYLDKEFDTDIMNFKTAVMKNTVVSPERIVEFRDWAWKEINDSEYIEKRIRQSVGEQSK